MSDRAETLSPLDAATLWPQLHRLSTEVIATRAGENVFMSAGFAATGLSRLPKLPHTLVVGVRRALAYRGVLVARELAGGAGWDSLSLRIARDKDDETVTALLAGTALEVSRRGGRILYLRFPDGSPHEAALRRGGMTPYRQEVLFAVPHRRRDLLDSAFRPAVRADRAGIFRLYCRAIPEHVRRHEATTQQEWRAVLDSYDCDHEYVLERERGLAAWVGIGDRECHVMLEPGVEGLAEAALDLVEAESPRPGTLVVGTDQGNLAHSAADRGYTQLGMRNLSARRLAVLNSLKEAVAAPVENLVPQ